MRTLLLTRPRAQSEAFAAALERALPGRFAPVIAPLMDIVPRETPIVLDGVAALAFTSANAVRVYASLTSDRTRPAFCVGASTAAAAREIGLAAHSADGNAAALAELIARDAPGPVLHLRGAEAAADLAELLPDRTVETAILYDQVPAEPQPEAHTLLRDGRIDAIALFSPAGAHRFASLARERGWRLESTRIVTISAAAAAPLSGLPLAGLNHVQVPSREAMITALGAL
jgi:uroporphyrinogen-III synthase